VYYCAALLKSFDVAKQLERLELPEVRALGPPKHRQQVIDNNILISVLRWELLHVYAEKFSQLLEA